jgi:hypothetical protein
MNLLRCGPSCCFPIMSPCCFLQWSSGQLLWHVACSPHHGKCQCEHATCSCCIRWFTHTHTQRIVCMYDHQLLPACRASTYEMCTASFLACARIWCDCRPQAAERRAEAQVLQERAVVEVLRELVRTQKEFIDTQKELVEVLTFKRFGKGSCWLLGPSCGN